MNMRQRKRRFHARFVVWFIPYEGYFYDARRYDKRYTK